MAVKNLPRQNVRSPNALVGSIFGQVFRSVRFFPGFVTIRQVFRSARFVVGFVIFMAILLTVLIYPIFVKDPPLATINRGSFLAPGIYVNLYDSMNSSTRYTLILDKAAER